MSKSLDVEAYLRRQISKNVWKPGDKLPSDNDISSELDVSYMTVKNVLRRLATEGILSRRKGSGTYVSEQAATRCIAVILRSEELMSANGYYYQVLVDEINRLALANQCKPMLVVGNGLTDEEFVDSIHFFESPMSHQASGVILLSGPKSVIEEHCVPRRIPAVSISAALPREGLPSVVLDYKSMIRQGIFALERHGYDDYLVVHLQGPGDRSDPQYYDGLSDLVCSMPSVNPESIVWLPWRDWRREGIYEDVKRLLSRKKLPKALFFLDDVVCQMACQVILELGLKVPDDVAIITHSNVGRTFNFPVSLTRLDFSPKWAATAAWDLLISLSEGQGVADSSSRVHIPPCLQIGDSFAKQGESD